MLKMSYKTRDEIPAGYEDLYTEQGDKWVLTGVEGMKTSEDVSKLQTALQKERGDHKKTKDRLSKLGGDDVDVDKVLADLDELEELRVRVAAGEGGKVDEAKMKALVDAKVAAVLRPVERERDALKVRAQALEGENVALKSNISRSTVENKLRELALNEKVVPSAIDDLVLMGSYLFDLDQDGQIVAKPGARGVPEGTSPEVWLTDLKASRPHLWPQTQGGGANGGRDGGVGGPNPWGAKTWDIEAQAALVRSNRAKAEQLAKAAGSRIGAPAPTV